MRLLLVRHGLTTETGHRLTGRRGGVGLSDEGTAAARVLAAELERLPVQAVYSSPVMRSRQTASILAGAFGLRPVTMQALTEVDYGRWTGRPLASLRRTRLWKSVIDEPSRVEFPGGERLHAVQQRAVTAVEGLAPRHPRQHVIAVTHADIVKSLVAHYLGAPLDLFQRLVALPTGVTVIDLPPSGRPTVIGLNVDPRLLT